MDLKAAVLCSALLLAVAPLCRSQSEPRPIVEHLGMLMWADEVSNFQVRAVQDTFTSDFPKPIALRARQLLDVSEQHSGLMQLWRLGVVQ